MTIPAYPLSWPEGWRRTLVVHRKRANFCKARERHLSQWAPSRALTISEGLARVLAELQRMGVGRDDVVISTNLQLRLDGLPRGSQAEPSDPGVAVYWQEAAGAKRVMAVDRYDRVADNLAAVAATLDAMRAIERHGGAVILERAFTGFTALPAPSAKREWWEVLGVARTAGIDEVRGAYRILASENHPDRGGDPKRMAEINEAWQRAKESA